MLVIDHLSYDGAYAQAEGMHVSSYGMEGEPLHPHRHPRSIDEQEGHRRASICRMPEQQRPFRREGFPQKPPHTIPVNSFQHPARHAVPHANSCSAPRLSARMTPKELTVEPYTGLQDMPEGRMAAQYGVLLQLPFITDCKFVSALRPPA